MPPPIGRRLPVAASRRVRRPGAWSRVSVPRRAAHRSRGAAPRGTSSGCECASPSPAPRGRRQRSNRSIVLLALRARYAVRWSLGTREAHRPPAAARRHRRVGGTARGASSFTASRSSRFARFDIVSFRSRRAAGHSRAASAGMERGPRHAGPRGPPRPANTRRETERAECQSERSEKCLQIAVKRGKGWTLECASFLR